MVFIYILKLEDNKYYIGKTDIPEFRLDAHFNCMGSTWTKKYKPIKLLKLIPNCSDFGEDKYTKEYMSKKGINNVRGGTYCKVKLDIQEIEIIKKELNGATNNCYVCGEKGHFANNCNNDYDNIEKLTNKLNKLLIEQDRCFRCHRHGHYAEECYAKKNIHGELICDSCESEEEEYIEVFCCCYCNREFETKKGADYHQKFYCRKR